MKGSLTISRPQYSCGKRAVRIEVEDDLSCVRFVTVEVPLEAFAEALTGMACVDVDFDVRGLQYVGMRKVTEGRTAVCPVTSYDKVAARAWLEANCQEPGWALNAYLGSRTSMESKGDGTCLLRYSVTRYVPAEPEA